MARRKMFSVGLSGEELDMLGMLAMAAGLNEREYLRRSIRYDFETAFGTVDDEPTDTVGGWYGKPS